MAVRNLLLPVSALFILILTACASKAGYFPTEPLPPPNLQAEGQQSGFVTVRVLLHFNATTLAFDDENFITALQVQAQVPMHYVAAVSADTHIYGLELPKTQSPMPALQRLQTLPSVARVEIDDKAKVQ